MNAGDEVDFAWITRENIGLLEGVGDDVFDEPIDPARLRRWADATDHLMLLALAEDRIVGMCTAMIHHHADKATELYVDEVGVADDYRRRGIARRLMMTMFERGRERGCTEAWVGTESDNRAARALYESLRPYEEDNCVFYLYRLDG